MVTWKKATLRRENGERVDMQTPHIVSASRSTDIPAFYADWFFHRLGVGYSAWTNPFNGVRSYVSYKLTRFIVFWSKNPRPLLAYLPYLKERRINCYVQFTLNDYEPEGFEPSVPGLQERIDTFRRLVDMLGVGGVVWRFDPLVLTEQTDIDTLLEKIRNIGDQLRGYTEKLVFSYADIKSYSKVTRNLTKNNIAYREWDEAGMRRMAEGIAGLNNAWHYQMGTCAEKIDLQEYGIEHNHCVDLDLIVRRAYNDPELMHFLGIKIEDPQLFGSTPGAIILPDGRLATTTKDHKDPGQRTACGCIISKDIGQYNTCVHRCVYCYANANCDIARQNYARHLTDPTGESIVP